MKPKNLLLILLIALQCSCSTVFGGKVTDCQKIKPDCGEPVREVRIVPLVADCLFFPIGIIGLIIDFSNNSIYKPCQPIK